MKILLVEDGVDVRMLLELILINDLRHEVVSFPSAINIPDDVFEDVDVVLTDWAMPEVSGEAVLERAAQLAPNARRIVITGSYVAEHNPSPLAHATIAKPFHRDTLRDALNG